MVPIYNYGLSQEDALTELAALDVRPGDRLLAVASGGEMPLNLLALRDVRIVAVDVAPAQLSLARLKQAACLGLEPSEAAAFLGFTGAPAGFRRRLFDRVSAGLDDGDRRFWNANMSALEAGPIRAGRFETFLGKVRFASLAVVKRKRLRDLFELGSPEERREFFDRFLGTPLLRGLFKLAFHPRVYRKRGIAAQGLIHGRPDGASGFFYGRFKDFCTATSPRRNYYLQFCFFGRVLFPEALPEYLTEEGTRRLRDRRDGIEWRLSSFEAALETAQPGAFNKFHLSNIGDWMSRREFAAVLASVAAKSGPSGRAAVRHIHLDHPVPEELRGRLARDDRRGEDLMRLDRFPFYRLVVLEAA
jgi:S-adenosylmethionine-diacylglycerol 3-amino-3-carboxypropyl transferase